MSDPAERPSIPVSSRDPQGNRQCASPTPPESTPYPHGARHLSQDARPIQFHLSEDDRTTDYQSPQGSRPYKRLRKWSTHKQQTQDISTGQQIQGPSTGQQPTQGPSTGQQQTQGTSTGQQQTQGPSTGQQQTQGTSTGQQHTQGTSTGQQHTQGSSTGQQHTQGSSTGQQHTQGSSTGQQHTQGTSTKQQHIQGTSTGQQHTQGSSTGQQTQSSSTGQKTQGCSTGQQTQVEAAETFWRWSINDWYPNLHTQTYFMPPLYFHKVPYDVQTVEDCGLSVLVPQEASDQPHHVPVVFNPSGPPPQVPSPPLASRVWPDQPVPAGPLPAVFDCDARDDQAMQRVLNCIRDLAERERLVMLVLSQLDFRKYLDNQVDPINAAAIRLLPRPATRGDFDVLMISEQYGLIVGEVKSVGADPSKIPDLDKAVVKTVTKAVTQLNKQGYVLVDLVSDKRLVKVTKILIVPNITSTQLLQALITSPLAQQALCVCLGAPDTTSAVSRCLCKDDMDSSSSQWWQRAVTDHGPDPNMSPDLYEVLVARFCGPATTIDVPTVTTPRRTVPLRTMSEAVALAGLTMAMLTLYPEQVELVNRPGLLRVFLWGPPGTGKTVILVIKGMQWGHQGKAVHLLSSHRNSRASTMLIEHQLHVSLGAGPTQNPSTSDLQVYTHYYYFDDNEEDVEAAVNELASAARDGELFVIADEAYSDREFDQFCTQLAARVPALHLWAAAVERDVTPACLSVEKLTTPVRCPPAVENEVRRSRSINESTVLSYTSRPAPAPTDGPEVRRIRHHTTGGSFSTPSPGHSEIRPEQCEVCADAIDKLMQDLHVGHTGHDLQYRDTIILCERPHDNLPVVTRLRARGLPVQVVTSDNDEAAIREVALAVCDNVTVTHYNVVRGLERRVVVVMGWKGDDRLHAMSRCTSLLVWVGEPL